MIMDVLRRSIMVDKIFEKGGVEESGEAEVHDRLS